MTLVDYFNHPDNAQYYVPPRVLEHQHKLAEALSNLAKNREENAYYMVFYKYKDSSTWMHSGLSKNKEEALEAIKKRPYVDEKYIVAKEIFLP